MTESDPLAQVDIEAFFEGVTEMRAHLERHNHDPLRCRQRLQRIAQGLLKPRSTRGFAAWLSTEVQSALGYDSGGIWICDGGWRLWHRAGADTTSAVPDLLEHLGGTDLRQLPGGEILVPIPGLSGTAGALWLKGGAVLDDDSRDLLLAIAGAAGMALSQALRVEALARDPATGLLSNTAFIEQAGVELRQVVQPLSLGIMSLRLAGTGGVNGLGEAAQSVFGPGTPLTMRTAERAGRWVRDLFAVPAVGSVLTGEHEVRDLAASLAARVAEAEWSAAVVFVRRPIDDLASVMEALSEALDDTKPGEVVKVRLG